MAEPVAADDPRWEALRAPFTGDEIGKLPKGPKVSGGDHPRCPVCGNKHPTAGYFHVDYVGHAHITTRLNEVDPSWRMVRSPIQLDSKGNAFMEVELTVLGVTHEEVGCAETGLAEWPKLLYSDCLTRAAMRFGLALDLWMKVRGGGEYRVYGGSDSGGGSGARSGSAGSGGGKTISPSVGVLWEDLKLAVGRLGDGGKAEWDDYKSEVGWSRIMATSEGRIVEGKREAIEAAGRRVREILASEKATVGEEPWDPLMGTGATGDVDVPEALNEAEGYGDYG